MSATRYSPLVCVVALLALILSPLPAEAAPFSWSSYRTVTVGDAGGVESPALTFADGHTGLEASNSDLVVDQDSPAVNLSSHTGLLLDLGAVNLDRVPPLSGPYLPRVPAVLGHVYLYEGNGNVAKFQATRVQLGAKQYSVPTVEIRYAYGTLDQTAVQPDAGSVDLGGAQQPATGQQSSGNQPADGSQQTTGQQAGGVQQGGTAPAGCPAQPGDVPTCIVATVVNGRVVLTWTAPTAAPTGGYNVYRGTAPEAAGSVPLGAAVNVPSYTDRNVQSGVTYVYVVEAVGGGRSQPVAVNATAASATAGVILFQPDNPVAVVDGDQQSLDVPPQIVNGRLMVPLRILGESLGATVSYDTADRRVDYTLGNLHLSLWIDRTDAVVNGQSKNLDAAPTIIGGRTLVPLRFVGENLGAVIAYDAATRTASITYSGSNGGSSQPQQPQKPSQPQSPSTGGATGGLTALFGTFQLRVPGAAYVVPGGSGYDIQKSGPGALSQSTLQLNPDGTYVWNSVEDGQVFQGSWTQVQDAEYPMLLHTARGGRDWKVGPSSPTTWGRGDLVLWDGGFADFRGDRIQGQ